MNKIITRFAPSPTGKLHIGNIRTALFSWLHSIKNKGKFILRIDDTDKKRCNKKYIENIINDLNWLKIYSNTNPIYQSNRKKRYIKVIKYMLSANKAYKCYCSEDQIKKIKEKQKKTKKKLHYNRYCRYNNNNYKNKNFVIRFKNPLLNSVTFNNTIGEKINISNQEIDDFIISKNINEVTYNFATAIDDIDMKITDIIRGSDHITNTVKQINIMNALNANIPKFIHLPMILSKEKILLSKRNNTCTINSLRKNGFLPEAIINYVLKLGWSYKNKEIFNKNEILNFFNINNINKSSSIFDINKLEWMNKLYVKNYSHKKMKNYILYFYKKCNFKNKMIKKINNIILMQKKRVSNIKDIVINSAFLYNEKIIFDKNLNNFYSKKKIIYAIKDIYNKFNIKKYSWKLNEIKNTFLLTLKKYNLSFYELAQSIRIIIMGTINSYPVYKLMILTGKKLTLKRINEFINLSKKWGYSSIR